MEGTYFAPEIHPDRGKLIDATLRHPDNRADIYSFGCIAHEVLAFILSLKSMADVKTAKDNLNSFRVTRQHGHPDDYWFDYDQTGCPQIKARVKDWSKEAQRKFPEFWVQNFIKLLYNENENGIVGRCMLAVDPSLRLSASETRKSLREILEGIISPGQHDQGDINQRTPSVINDGSTDSTPTTISTPISRREPSIDGAAFARCTTRQLYTAQRTDIPIERSALPATAGSLGAQFEQPSRPAPSTNAGLTVGSSVGTGTSTASSLNSAIWLQVELLDINAEAERAACVFYNRIGKSRKLHILDLTSGDYCPQRPIWEFLSHHRKPPYKQIVLSPPFVLAIGESGVKTRLANIQRPFVTGAWFIVPPFGNFQGTYGGLTCSKRGWLAWETQGQVHLWNSQSAEPQDPISKSLPLTIIRLAFNGAGNFLSVLAVCLQKYYLYTYDTENLEADPTFLLLKTESRRLYETRFRMVTAQKSDKCAIRENPGLPWYLCNTRQNARYQVVACDKLGKVKVMDTLVALCDNWLVTAHLVGHDGELLLESQAIDDSGGIGNAEPISLRGKDSAKIKIKKPDEWKLAADDGLGPQSLKKVSIWTKDECTCGKVKCRHHERLAGQKGTVKPRLARVSYVGSRCCSGTLQEDVSKL